LRGAQQSLKADEAMIDFKEFNGDKEFGVSFTYRFNHEAALDGLGITKTRLFNRFCVLSVHKLLQPWIVWAYFFSLTFENCLGKPGSVPADVGNHILELLGKPTGKIRRNGA
jgi:hypothetical protein